MTPSRAPQTKDELRQAHVDQTVAGYPLLADFQRPDDGSRWWVCDSCKRFDHDGCVMAEADEECCCCG